jgi:peptidoglycan/xylan/chitin deacetylase (PgdA/CDA1 family)
MLTFDDGPEEGATAELLDLLAADQATGTFFVIAPRAQACPDLIERMVGEGHTVGLHCDEHFRHSERSRAWVAADTERALARLRRVGIRPTLWRTPYGVTADWTPDVAAEHGLRLVGWTVDTNDWRGHEAEAMFAATRPQLIPEAIVLAHDGIGPGARRAKATETLAYVRLALAHARREGLSVAAI